MIIPGSKIIPLLDAHNKLRSEGLNLIASENYLSEKVRAALASDLGGRYHSDWYGGTKFIREVIETTEELAKKLFKTKHAIVSPLAGNICDLAALFTYTKPGEKIAILPMSAGGYPLGAAKFDRQAVYLPARKNRFELDVDPAKKVILDEQPRLIVLGASYIPFPHPVQDVSRFLKEVDFPNTLVFDGAHVMGLIASGTFQDPLNEGAEVLFGSTHKSLYGPQGGVMLTNSTEHYEALLKYFEVDIETGIGLVDNPHVNRIAALGAAFEELMEDQGYGERVIENAQTLAKALDELGVPVKFKDQGFTRSHQVFIDIDATRAEKFCHELETVDIFIDLEARLGTAEVTHRGMGTAEMESIAQILAEAYTHGVNDEIRQMVKKLALGQKLFS
jgi:glycine hydroxymethyltransferase